MATVTCTYCQQTQKHAAECAHCGAALPPLSPEEARKEALLATGLFVEVELLDYCRQQSRKFLENVRWILDQVREKASELPEELASELEGAAGGLADVGAPEVDEALAQARQVELEVEACQTRATEAATKCLDTESESEAQTLAGEAERAFYDAEVASERLDSAIRAAQRVLRDWKEAHPASRRPAAPAADTWSDAESDFHTEATPPPAAPSEPSPPSQPAVPSQPAASTQAGAPTHATAASVSETEADAVRRPKSAVKGALVNALVPGLGQIYAGDRAGGITVLVVSLLAIVVTAGVALVPLVPFLALYGLWTVRKANRGQLATSSPLATVLKTVLVLALVLVGIPLLVGLAVQARAS